MIERLHDRARWIEQNLLPYEAEIRRRLARNRVYGLEIDDVIQEMYADIGALKSVDSIRDPRRYAFQVARSIVVHHVRRSSIVAIIPSGGLGDLETASQEATPEDIVAARQTIQDVGEAIEKLPVRTQKILILRRVMGLSQRETANRLAIAEKTVEKHMTRATMMLLDRFGRGGKKVPCHS